MKALLGVSGKVYKRSQKEVSFESGTGTEGNGVPLAGEFVGWAGGDVLWRGRLRNTKNQRRLKCNK